MPRRTASRAVKTLALAAFALVSAAACGAQGPFRSEIAFLDGEKWFGGSLNLGGEQPYGADATSYDRRYRSEWFDLANACWGGATVPFLLSDKGRYVWSDRPFRYRFERGTLVVESKTEKVEPVAAGATLREAYFAACARHFPFSGNPPPDEFFTKPQFNNWIEMYVRGVNQKVCEEYVDEIAANGFPCGVHMVDGGWMLYHGAVKFDPETYPDPKRLFAKIRANGWKSMLWFAYFVSPDSRLEYRRYRYYPHKGRGGYAQGLDYLLHVKNPKSRNAAVVRWWSGISAAFDLTNPEVLDHFVKRIGAFASEYGIDGFKFDAGNPEYMIGDCRFHEPWMEPCDYSAAWNAVGLAFPYNEFRSGFKTGGQPLVQRLHDQPHTWEALREIVGDMIVAGLLGYPYAVPDMIGGGLCASFHPAAKIDEKLVVRSCQLQALMPMMQFSLAPWRVLSPENCAICRDCANLHVEFGPRIASLARHAAKTGEPIMRSMDFQFPGEGFGDCFTQFTLGPDVVVAPVITPDDRVEVRLPAGEWTDDLGARHEGPKRFVLENVPLARLPRYARAGAAENGGNAQ